MRRGHVLALMLVFIAAISASIATFTSRVTLDLAARRADDTRVQALWLARSALETGQTGRQTVPTGLGEATVLVRGDVATVTLLDATATVTAAPWTERFTPAAE
ncbi:MAG: hypothetical protein ACI8RZ_001216 [Myxococcota bacterium]|jgi:hypothetical protein